jgi:hypothetical protein
VAGVFQGKSKKETAADGSSVEHRDDKAAVKGWFSFVPMRALRRGMLTFSLGAGAGNFSAVGAADLEETKKSDAADWREEGKINHI